MPKITKTLTHEEMTEALYLRAEEIFLLCAIITRRGIAHAFCALHSHVGRLESRVLAVDQKYERGTPQLKIAELDAHLEPYERMIDSEMAEEFNNEMEEMETYINYLDLLIAKNAPMLTSQQEAA
ncbi:hypothetical protein [Marinobacter sp.]|uniref:hypothetical protein n=1 Tax=Marinobacter sp. TaxID=50741 RepID=UPI003A914049